MPNWPSMDRYRDSDRILVSCWPATKASHSNANETNIYIQKNITCTVFVLMTSFVILIFDIDKMLCTKYLGNYYVQYIIKFNKINLLLKYIIIVVCCAVKCGVSTIFLSATLIFLSSQQHDHKYREYSFMQINFL